MSEIRIGLTMADNSGPVWELSKENVQPLKMGRKVGGLSTVQNRDKLVGEEE